MKFPFWKKAKTSDEKSANVPSLNDILGKLTDLFNPNPQKEKVLRHEDFNKAGDTYYASVTVGYKIAQRLLVLFMVLFLVVSLITNFNEITYDNFFYLIKDFSNAVDFESSNYDTLSYSSDARHFFSLYRGGLAIANPSGISVFTATGRQTLRTATQFSAPCIKSADKYFIVYDTAGTDIAVFNSFSRIYSESFDYPVTDACFSDDGKMAIATKNIDHKSIVHVYNKNFEKLFSVPSNEYVFDICMDTYTDSLLISYYDIGDGNGVSKLSLRKISAPVSEFSTIELSGEFLLCCDFIGNNQIAAVTDKAVHIFNSSLEEEKSHEYINSEVSGFCVNEYGVSVSYIRSSQNVAVVFDTDGEMIYNSVINDTVKDIGLYEKFVFLRTDTGVYRIDTSNSSQLFLPSKQGRMLVYNSDTALVCGESKAEYLVFYN